MKPSDTHKTLRVRSWRARILAVAGLVSAGSLSGVADALAQAEEGIRPGEAYVTRFSGTTGGSKPRIDIRGTVGGIIDVRAHPEARGQHWIDEPQRLPATAGQVGQVFGVAIGGGTNPNIYLTATSAFGLHVDTRSGEWMAGMWGEGGGPGSVYVISGENGYEPQLLTNITLEGRENSGPGLGNIAYDRFNDQLFVTDLETGMIHRIGTDGSDRGHFDHGMTGRGRFADATTGKPGRLKPVGFDPESAANREGCEVGEFSRTPECWNIADFRRRVWGIGVRRDAETGEVRVYYSVWSGQGFGNPDFERASEDSKVNTVWSVGLTEDGDFDTDSVRLEIQMPDFFSKEEDIARAGFSHPVSDIAFKACGEQKVMLLAERGGIRNLGLSTPRAFATPSEARALRYELDETGVWRPIGRYDVGYYDRKAEGQPFERANCAGGVAFGPEGAAPAGDDGDGGDDGGDEGGASSGGSGGGSASGEGGDDGDDEGGDEGDTGKSETFVWITGDGLCSREGPCFLLTTRKYEDDVHVDGLQGTPASAISPLVPEGAFKAYPKDGPASPNDGPSRSIMTDTDINIDADGRFETTTAFRDDSTRIGDVEIFVVCEKAGPVGPPTHSRDRTHRRYGSVAPPPPHDREMSHLRFGSADGHRPRVSHRRFGTRVHTRRMTHRRFGSRTHRPRASHRRNGTRVHRPRASHRRDGTRAHRPRASHRRDGTRAHRPRASHRRDGTRAHRPRASHRRDGTRAHRPRASHRRDGTRAHRPRASHRRTGTRAHRPRASHRRDGTRAHRPRASHRRTGTRAHRPRASHRRTGTRAHRPRASHRRTGTRAHRPRASHRRTGTRAHRPRASHRRTGTRAHRPRASHRRTGTRAHRPRASHRRTGTRAHRPRASHRRTGTRAHRPRASHRRTGTRVHRPAASHRRTGTRRVRGHRPAASHRRAGSRRVHNRRQTHQRRGSNRHRRRDSRNGVNTN